MLEVSSNNEDSEGWQARGAGLEDGRICFSCRVAHVSYDHLSAEEVFWSPGSMFA